MTRTGDSAPSEWLTCLGFEAIQILDPQFGLRAGAADVGDVFPIRGYDGKLRSARRRKRKLLHNLPVRGTAVPQDSPKHTHQTGGRHRSRHKEDDALARFVPALPRRGRCRFLLRRLDLPQLLAPAR